MKFPLRLAALLFLALSSAAPALAQSTLLQGGTFGANRVPMYVNTGQTGYTQPIVQDSGPAGGGGPGIGLSELNITAQGTGTPPYNGQGSGPAGTISCLNDAPTDNPAGYHYFCFSPLAGAGGLIDYGAAGGAAQTPLIITINGASYSFPFAISGIVGPPVSVVGDLACWNNTVGTLLKDCGIDSTLRFSGSVLGVNPATTILQNLTTVWSGGFPGTNNLGIDLNQTFSGTPTGSGFPFSGGNGGLPLNLIDITSDQLNWTGAGGRQGLMLKYSYGGGSSAGDIMGFAVDCSQTGAIAAGTNNNACIQGFQGAFANVAGAASGAGDGKGSDFMVGLNYCRLQSGIFRHECDGSEYDLSPSTGSSSDYVEFAKFVSLAPAGWVANQFQTFLSFSQNAGALSPHVLTFGDPQSSGFSTNGFPAASTGDLLFAYAGTVGTAIDFSNLTATDLIKGPNSFAIDGSNYVHSNRSIPATGNEWGVFNSSGQAAFDVESGANLASFIRVFGQASGAGPAIVQAVSGGSGTDLNMSFQTANTTAGQFNFNDSNNFSAFQIQEVASAISRVVATDAATGNPALLDVGGTATGLSIGASTATSIKLGKSGVATTIAGNALIGAGSAITSSGPGGALGNPAFVASSVSKTCGATIVVSNGVVTSC